MSERKPLDAQFVGKVNSDAMRALGDVNVRRKWADSNSGSPVTTNALCAEIARLNLEREWRLIDTAPHGDDDFFLVCGVGDERSAFVVRGSILASATKPGTPSHLHMNWLTHWMPLPPKPQA